MNVKIYEFEDYLLDIQEQRLQKNGEDISLPPKVFEVLTVLIKNHKKLVSYDQLMNEVWQDTFVEETNLRYCIRTLRKAFDEDFIETVPKSGYRFNAQVRTFSKEEFIKKHTGSYRIEELREPDGPVEERDNFKPFFTKPAGIIAIAGLMAVVGFLGFYFWQNGESGNENSARTITVLPFSIIGEDSAVHIDLQKGLADSMYFNLSKIKGLKITPTSDIQKFSDKKLDAVSIGKQFSSDFVLEGSYRYEGDRSVRVNTRLLDVKNEQTLLNETITVKADSKIKTENIISLRIAAKIYEKLAETKDREYIKTQNISDEAKKLYLKGQEILLNFDFDRKKEGVETFEKMTKLEPNWAKGYAKVAEALVYLHGGFPDWELVKQNAEKALSLDQDQPEAHLALGWYHQAKFDWANAEKAFLKAIELDPEYSVAYNEYGLVLDVQRKFSEAEKKFQKAIELKPFDPFYLTSQCNHFFYDKKFDLAIKSCNQALDIDPEFSLPEKSLFWIYIYLQEYESAFNVGAGKNDPENVESVRLLKSANSDVFWKKRIGERLNDKERRYSPAAIAYFYAQLQDEENTLKYLEEMAEVVPYDINRVNPDPAYDFLRKEPRFVALLKKFNLAS